MVAAAPRVPKAKRVITSSSLSRSPRSHRPQRRVVFRADRLPRPDDIRVCGRFLVCWSRMPWSRSDPYIPVIAHIAHAESPALVVALRHSFGPGESVAFVVGRAEQGLVSSTPLQRCTASRTKMGRRPGAVRPRGYTQPALRRRGAGGGAMACATACSSCGLHRAPRPHGTHRVARCAARPRGQRHRAGAVID